MVSIKENKKYLIYIIFIILSLTWGSSFILIKKGLLAFSAAQVASLRIIIAGIVFLPYVLINIKKINPQKIKYIIYFGLLEIGIPPFLYSIAQTKIDSSTAGILNSLVPVFTLIAGFFFHQVFKLYKFLGVLLGLMGAAALIFTRIGGKENGIMFDLANIYGLLIVLATLFYGIATNIIKTYLQDEPSLFTIGLAIVLMAIPASIYLFVFDKGTFDFHNILFLKSLGAVSILSVFGTVIAMVLFTKLIQISSALFASFVAYAIPIVALSWAYLDKEPFNILQPVSMIFILMGIYLVAWEKKNIDIQSVGK